jgi:hypothetical protein
VSFENKSAALGKFAMGSLSWEGAGKTVTSPIAVRPQSAVAAKEDSLTSESGTGSGDISDVSGTDKPINMTLDGLSKADSTAVELVPGPFTGSADASTFVKTVQVPAGVPLANFSVISSDPNADFDMWVVTPGGVEQVATASASESLSIPNPAAGSYTIYANLYSSPDDKARTASMDAAVLGANENNATLTPNPLVLPNGETGKVTLKWTGLQPGSYLGRVTYADSTEATFVSVIVNAAGAASVAPAPDGSAGQLKFQNQEPDRPDNAT